MPEGRAPWPRFATECRRVIGPVLSQLGYQAKPARGDQVCFEHPEHLVEISWDPCDVILDVRLDGIAMARLLDAAGLRAPVKREVAAPSLREVADALVRILGVPQLPALLADARTVLATLQRGNQAALVRLLQSTATAEIRARAAIGIGELGKATATAVAALAGALADPDASLRMAAASALYHVGLRAPKVAARALARGVQDAERSVRRESLLALRQLGKLAAPAATVLVGVVRQGVAAEALLATEVLWGLSRARTHTAIRGLADSPRKRDRDRATRLQRLIATLPGRRK